MLKKIAVGGLLGALSGVAGAQLALRAGLLPVANGYVYEWQGMVGGAVGGALAGGAVGGMSSGGPGTAAFTGSIAGFGGGLLGHGVGARVALAMQ